MVEMIICIVKFFIDMTVFSVLLGLICLVIILLAYIAWFAALDP